MIFDQTAALNGLLGGLLIGLAGAVLLLGAGAVAGVSGILGRLLRTGRPDMAALAFVGGLVVSPLLLGVGGWRPDVTMAANLPMIVLAGILVGSGAALGNGCTSGHGVCGLSRLSPRSLAATATFMAVGVAVASLLRPVLGG